MLNSTHGTTTRPGFSGPPLSPTNQPDPMELSDELRRIARNVPVGCTAEGLLSYLEPLKKRATYARDVYLVARHLDDPDLQPGLLAQSKELRIYLGISKNRWYAHHSSQLKIEPERAAETLAWAATRMSEKYQQRAIALLETALPRATLSDRSQALKALNDDFDKLSDASRLQVAAKLMKPTNLLGVPDAVLWPLQQSLNALHSVVAPACRKQIDQVANGITRTMYQNLAANLPDTFPEPISFHTDRTGPELLRNIATSIKNANLQIHQNAALDLLTPSRLAALPPSDREKVRSTLRETLLPQAGSRSAVGAIPRQVADRIDQLLQMMTEQDAFLTPLRTWQQQPTIPPSASGKQIAVARIIDCWQTGAPNLNLSRLGLSTLPAVLPPHIKGLNVNENALTSLPTLPAGLTHLIASNNQLSSLPTLPDGLEKLFVFGNQIEQLPALPAGLTELRVSKNPLLTNVRIAELSLLNLKCKVNLTGTHINPEDLTRLHMQIAHLGGPEVIPSAELPLPTRSLIDALHWLTKRISNLPESMQRRALDRILAASFDDIATADIERLGQLLPATTDLPTSLHMRLSRIRRRIGTITPPGTTSGARPATNMHFFFDEERNHREDRNYSSEDYSPAASEIYEFVKYRLTPPHYEVRSSKKKRFARWTFTLNDKNKLSRTGITAISLDLGKHTRIRAKISGENSSPRSTLGRRIRFIGATRIPENTVNFV